MQLGSVLNSYIIGGLLPYKSEEHRQFKKDKSHLTLRQILGLADESCLTCLSVIGKSESTVRTGVRHREGH